MEQAQDVVDMTRSPIANETKNPKKATKNNNNNSSQGGQIVHILTEYEICLKKLKQTGHQARSDLDQPSLSTKPDWFDENLFENAKSVYARHFMGVNFAHLSGLLLLVRINSIYRTLSATGKSDSVAKLFNRYYQTIIHVKKWYEGDIFDENSDAYRSLLIVRGMHNKVSRTLNDVGANPIKVIDTTTIIGDNDQNNNDPVDESKHHDKEKSITTREESKQKFIVNSSRSSEMHGHDNGAHLSQYDIMITQFAFIGFIVTKANNMGLLDDFNQKDLESLLHFWRVIGFYLGASDEYNLCSYKSNDLNGMCQAIIDLEYKQSIIDNPIHSSPGIMSVNIVRSVKFIPMLTIYGIMRYLYELLDIDTIELASKESGFTRLSYKLIKLVMSRLLAYKALRSFNNGLCRLSVYLVGKIDNWFINRLDSRYGQEMKL